MRLLVAVTTVVLTAVVACSIAIGIWNNYSSHLHDVVQDIRVITFERTTRARLSQTQLDLILLNGSACDTLMRINQSSGGGGVGTPPLMEAAFIARLVGNMTLAMGAADERILSLTGVHGDVLTKNVELVVVGDGLALFENTGVVSLSAGSGITFDDGTRVIGNSGVLKFEVDSDMVGGDGTVTLAGTHGISVSGGAANVTTSGESMWSKLESLMQIAQIQSDQLYNLTIELQRLREEFNTITTVGGGGGGPTVNDIIQLLNRLHALQELFNSIRGVQTGTLVAWGGGGAEPEGYIACDGATYPVPANETEPLYALFGVIGYLYCDGGMTCANGSSLFAVPDLRGRLPVGRTAAAPTSVFDEASLGAVVGEETHTLTESELATHTHTLSGHTGNARTNFYFASNFNATTGFGTRTSAQSYLTQFAANVNDNFRMTCPTGFGANNTNAYAWSHQGSLSTTGGSNGYCTCNPLDAYVKNAAIGVAPAYMFPSMLPPPPNLNNGDASAQLGIFHPTVGSKCSVIQFPSFSYAHTHTNGNSGGGSVPMPVVQPSLVTGGYLIKT